MRSERFRRSARVAVALAGAALLVAACDSTPPEDPSASRFASVRKQARDQAATSFCEKVWPASAPGARRYEEIPERPLAGVPAPAAARGGTWRWVNLWATWCLPCVEEMGLLARWKSSLEKDGIPLEVELWSVDEEEGRLREYLETAVVPGRVRWLRAPADLPAVLESLGADRAAAIPVHALVDGTGHLRCLRVGSVHEEDYGAVKSLLAGG